MNIDVTRVLVCLTDQTAEVVNPTSDSPLHLSRSKDWDCVTIDIEHDVLDLTSIPVLKAIDHFRALRVELSIRQGNIVKDKKFMEP